MIPLSTVFSSIGYTYHINTIPSSFRITPSVVKHWSTSKSTWSSMHRTSTWPWYAQIVTLLFYTRIAITRQTWFTLWVNRVIVSQGYYFERDDVALLGFAKFFKKASGEEREHGTRFMEYQGRWVILRSLFFYYNQGVPSIFVSYTTYHKAFLISIL